MTRCCARRAELVLCPFEVIVRPDVELGVSKVL
jgi:hypothetical protein